MLIVIGRAFCRIEEAARHRRPRRFLWNMGIGEKIEVIKLHESNSPSAKTSRNANTHLVAGQTDAGRRSRMDDRKIAILDTLSSILNDAPRLLVVTLFHELVDEACVYERGGVSRGCLWGIFFDRFQRRFNRVDLRPRYAIGPALELVVSIFTFV